MSPTGSSTRRRLACRIGAVSAAVACSAAFAGPAMAQGPALPDIPAAESFADTLARQTNIPNLAWRGESVRLVECAPAVGEATLDLLTNATMQVEDWTGDPHFKPIVQNSSEIPFVNEDGDVCISGNLASMRAGLAAVKITVTNLTDLFNENPDVEPLVDELENEGILDIVGNKAVLQRQALVGWMNIGPSTMENLGDGEVDAGDALEVGTAGGANDQEMQVQVSGLLPMEGEYGAQIRSDAGLGGGNDAIQLPQQYGEMADALAHSAANVSGQANRLLWDIHDAQGEGTTENCATTPRSAANPNHDPVGDCGSGNEVGLFSRILDIAGTLGGPVADTTAPPTIGPFDPQRADSTHLGDGITDEDDAPMPALRVDFDLGADDVGSLVASNKSSTYQAPYLNDVDNTPAGGHNLFAPFYRQYIPATAAPQSDASGIDGPSTGRNFPGFLVDDSEYDNWDTYSRLALGGDTDCLLSGGVNRPLPTGDRGVTVYTDEHGEARVAFAAGVGAFYDEIGELNGNGGCDLQDGQGNPIDLGGNGAEPDATVTATALYPYQPIQARGIAIDTADITVNNLFSKTVAVTRKSGNASNANVFVVTSTAQDVDGTPFANERVCFRVNGGFPAPGFPEISVPGIDDTDWQCTRSNAEGIAKVEFVRGADNVVPVTAFFVDELLFRSVTATLSEVPVGPAPNPGPGTPPPGGTPTPGNQPAGGQAVAAAAENRQAAVAVVSATGAKKVGATLAYSKVKRTKSGKRVLKVRVNSSAATAKLRVQLRARGGKTVRRMTITVRTNREVTVKGLSIGKQVRSVKASVVS